jgi:16S rRNA processing protein RimM
LKSLPKEQADDASSSESIANVNFDTRAAVIVGAHGVQGTVKVKPVTSTSFKLFTPAVRGVKEVDVWLGSDRDNGRVYHVLSSKRQEPKDIYLVRLRGVDDRTSAENLVSQSIFGKSEDREPLSEDEFFVEDLIGLSIVDRNEVDLGHLTVVHSGVANDVYESDQGLMIPAVKAFIDKIDIAQRKITVIDAAALVIE